MSRRNAIPLLAAITLLAACAAPQPTWRKVGVSADDTLSAHSECKYQIGLNKIPAEKKDEMLKECMQGKGFRWRAY